ncbi:MAG: E3 binding domain-containing protein, partial [Planctomycetaceae bacterium]|nr:E3 binding domain-containing protein [Planctomycetaceae bacterium]
MANEVKVPDIGDFKDVPIIEIHVKEGDAINAEDPLVTLESDKATMDVPAPSGGTVERLLVKVGDRVSAGSPILLFQAGDGAMTQPPSLITQQEPPPTSQPVTAAPAPARESAVAPAPAAPVDRVPAADFGQVHASPSVRRIARELTVDLTKIKGTGEKGRITKEDVIAFLKGPS